MDLPVGTRLGNFEILGGLGSGGMGEVYRARDSRLHRDVALKVLPAFIRTDPERVARFEREATILASLNHPNIAAIHGVEDADGKRALVLELVEGPTLGERIARGPIPITEVLAIAIGICDAMDAAHSAGIVHRDLKPANVKVRPDGTVKVLDFGLARALDGDLPQHNLENSPTITGLATRAGTILGTAAYMSPEQARGGVVDRRADIWAFGCVLYEMLTARRAFAGHDATDTIAAVIRDEPQWDLLPQRTPDAVQRLLRRCLAKDPKSRLRDIADARVELREDDSSRARRDPMAAPTGLRSSSAFWIMGVVAASLISALVTKTLTRPAPPSALPVSRFTITLPAAAPSLIGSDSRAFTNSKALALSVDGTRLVYVGPADGGNGSRLYLQELSASSPRPLDGTEGASAPFFSSDGQAVGFFARAKLKRVSVAGGGVSTICDAPDDTGGSGGTWGPNDTIVFAVRDSARAGLFRVPAGGGAPEIVTKPDPSEEGGHGDPSFIPGTQAVLFVTRETKAGVPISIQVVDLLTKQQHKVTEGTQWNTGSVPGSSRPLYLASGHLIFQSGGTVLAAPFDTKTLRMSGAPVVVVENVSSFNFDVSAHGRFVYVGSRRYGGRLVWVDRHGSAEPVMNDAQLFGRPRLSPDGGRLVAEVVRDSRVDIGVYRFDNRALTLLTADGRGNSPYWHPDAGRVVFRTVGKLLWQPANAATPAEVFLSADDSALRGTSALAPGVFSPDGSSYTFVVHGSTETGADIWRMDVGGADRHIRPVVQRPGNQWGVRVSPDGQWISYASNESGRFEVFIEPYSGGRTKYQVSTDGGGEGVWSPDGRELFYRKDDGMFAVPITHRSDSPVGAPQLLFTGRYVSTDLPHYDVTRDGKRFVMIQPVEDESTRTINVVENWFEELRARVPGPR